MRYSRSVLLSSFRCASILTVIAIAGCGDACFVGFSNNGNGGAIIKAGNPAPACSLSQTMGTMNPVVVQSPTCQMCPAETRAEHLFMTVRSVRLVPSATTNTNSSDWSELAPQLASEPRQIDLIGDLSEPLAENALVPAGSYAELRLQFLSTTDEKAAHLPAHNRCGQTFWNCLVTGDGHVEQVVWPRNPHELLVRLEAAESGPLIVLPDAAMSLRIRLQPMATYTSGTEGLRLEHTLAGSAVAIRQSPAEVPSPN